MRSMTAAMTMINFFPANTDWTLRLTTGFALLYTLAAFAGYTVDARTLGGENF